MDINESLFELVLNSLQIALKHKHITKEEYKQMMIDALEIKGYNDQKIGFLVELYVNMYE